MNNEDTVWITACTMFTTDTRNYSGVLDSSWFSHKDPYCFPQSVFWCDSYYVGNNVLHLIIHVPVLYIRLIHLSKPCHQHCFAFCIQQVYHSCTQVTDCHQKITMTHRFSGNLPVVLIMVGERWAWLQRGTKHTSGVSGGVGQQNTDGCSSFKCQTGNFHPWPFCILKHPVIMWPCLCNHDNSNCQSHFNSNPWSFLNLSN